MSRSNAAQKMELDEAGQPVDPVVLDNPPAFNPKRPYRELREVGLQGYIQDTHLYGPDQEYKSEYYPGPKPKRASAPGVPIKQRLAQKQAVRDKASEEGVERPEVPEGGYKAEELDLLTYKEVADLVAKHGLEPMKGGPGAKKANIEILLGVG